MSPNAADAPLDNFLLSFNSDSEALIGRVPHHLAPQTDDPEMTSKTSTGSEQKSELPSDTIPLWPIFVQLLPVAPSLLAEGNEAVMVTEGSGQVAEAASVPDVADRLPTNSVVETNEGKTGTEHQSKADLELPYQGANLRPVHHVSGQAPTALWQSLEIAPVHGHAPAKDKHPAAVRPKDFDKLRDGEIPIEHLPQGDVDIHDLPGTANVKKPANTPAASITPPSGHVNLDLPVICKISPSQPFSVLETAWQHNWNTVDIALPMTMLPTVEAVKAPDTALSITGVVPATGAVPQTDLAPYLFSSSSPAQSTVRGLPKVEAVKASDTALSITGVVPATGAVPQTDLAPYLSRSLSPAQSTVRGEMTEGKRTAKNVFIQQHLSTGGDQELRPAPAIDSIAYSTAGPSIEDPDGAIFEAGPAIPTPTQTAQFATSQTADPQAKSSVLPAVIPTIVEMVKAGNDGPLELSLAPHELGRLTITLKHEGDFVLVTVSADRPDTLDLMRRHSSDFLADLRQSGFSGASFNFGQGSRGQHPQFTSPGQLATTSVTSHVIPPDQPPARPVRPRKAIGMDLRF